MDFTESILRDLATAARVLEEVSPVATILSSMHKWNCPRPIRCVDDMCNGPVETLGGGTVQNGKSKYRYRCRRCQRRWQQFPPHKYFGDLQVKLCRPKLDHAICNVEACQRPGLEMSMYVDVFEIFDPDKNDTGMGMRDIFICLKQKQYNVKARTLYSSDFKNLMIHRISQYRKTNTIHGLGPRYVHVRTGSAKFIGVRPRKGC